MLYLSPLKVNQFVPNWQFLPRAPVGKSAVGSSSSVQPMKAFMLIWEVLYLEPHEEGTQQFRCFCSLIVRVGETGTNHAPGIGDGAHYPSCTHAGAGRGRGRGRGQRERVPLERPEVDSNIGITFLYSFGLLSLLLQNKNFFFHDCFQAYAPFI